MVGNEISERCFEVVPQKNAGKPVIKFLCCSTESLVTQHSTKSIQLCFTALLWVSSAAPAQQGKSPWLWGLIQAVHPLKVFLPLADKISPYKEFLNQVPCIAILPQAANTALHSVYFTRPVPCKTISSQLDPVPGSFYILAELPQAPQN